MAGSSHQMTPAPVDYSAAMMNMSNNQTATQMAGIGAQIIGMNLMSANRSDQIAANLESSLEQLDTKVQIAKLNFSLAQQAEGNRHTEAMTAIDTATHSTETTETADFLA